jgi:PPM family protein phosphatase
MLRAFGATDTGVVRSSNEDVFAIEESLNLCLVADGMGGHNAGEVASRLAVDAILGFVRESAARGLESANDTWPFGFDWTFSTAGNLLRTAVQIANLHVLRTAGSSDEYAGMGTTVVAAMVAGGRLSVAHVGDSRLYIVADGRIRQLTNDDSWMATVLAQNPQVDPTLLQQHPMRNALTNVVGARPQLDVHIVEEALKGGERMLLTTDGVHGVLDEASLLHIVLDRTVGDWAAAELITTALRRGSRDNCTAVVAEYSA